MAHRIEIMFVGEAPESELERAKILGSSDIVASIEALRALLSASGLADVVVIAKSIKEVARRSPKRRAAASLAAE